MRSKRHIFGVLAIVLATSVLVSYVEAAEKIQFRLNLQKGRTYSLRTVVEQEISQEFQGQKQDMDQKVSMGYTFHVEDVDADKIASVKFTYHSISFEQNDPMKTVKYDSSESSAGTNPTTKAFSALVGQSLWMKIAPDGSIRDVQGMDQLIAHVMKSMDMPDGHMKSSMEENLKKQFGDQGVKDLMAASITGVYPDSPMGKGDSWKKRVAMSAGMSMILENNCTLRDRKNGVAIVDVHTKIMPNTEAPPTDMGFVKVSYDISGVQEGTLEIDETTGWIISGKFTQEFSGTVKMEGMVSREMPMSVKGTIRLGPLEEE